MDWDTLKRIQTADLVLKCSNVNRTLSVFKEELGFQSDATFGADDPSIVVISGQGLRIRLERVKDGVPESRVPESRVMDMTLPDSADRRDIEPELKLPPLKASPVVHKLNERDWHEGRVKGMFYRDLIPGRQGGRFIASHIRVLNEGLVEDDVHFHWIQFQMIYCYKGRVRLVYEGRPEFVMKAGDCVLQPPEIRHQVLEVLEKLEVIEICCPAEHWTVHDRSLDLTKASTQPERAFGGAQLFSYHDVDAAVWQPHQRLNDFEYRDLGIASGTHDLAGGRVIRPARRGNPWRASHKGELFFMFVLQGELTLNCGGKETRLTACDSFVVPAGTPHELTAFSDDLQLLEVTLPVFPDQTEELSRELRQ